MNLIKDIYKSFRALPVWVQIWVALWLVPINVVAIIFIGETNGVLVATLTISGMAFNIIPMVLDRGFGKAMAFPHLIVWVPLVIVLLAVILPNEPASTYKTYLWILLATNVVSLAFDFKDARDWLKGDRQVPRS